MLPLAQLRPPGKFSNTLQPSQKVPLWFSSLPQTLTNDGFQHYMGCPTTGMKELDGGPVVFDA